MAAISQQIPNLLGGVSQQADPLKLAGQVKESINAYLDPTFGCRKRPPLQYIKNLASDIPSAAKWFFILRDSNERYAVTIYKNPRKIKNHLAADGISDAKFFIYCKGGLFLQPNVGSR